MKRLTLDDVICPVCCVLLPLDNDGCPECGHQDQLQGRIPPIRAYSDRLHYPGMRALIGRLPGGDRGGAQAGMRRPGEGWECSSCRAPLSSRHRLRPASGQATTRPHLALAAGR